MDCISNVILIGTKVRYSTGEYSAQDGRITDFAIGTPKYGGKGFSISVASKEGATLCYQIDKAHWLPYTDVRNVNDPIPTKPNPMSEDENPNNPGILCHKNPDVLCWKTSDMEDRPDNSRLPEIVSLLLAIQWHKEGSYGSSWCGKGEYRGIMANIDRKYDRLDKMTSDEIQGRTRTLPTYNYATLKALVEQGQEMESVGESKIDAVADLANYCLLYLTYLRHTYPGAFEMWVERNVPSYLRERISLL